MATRTVTFAASNQPKSHIGYNAIALTYTQDISSLTASDGDIILWQAQGKIPHGAIIVDARLAGDTTDGGIIYQLGYSGATAVLGSATLSNVPTIKPFLGGALPHTISVSDDNPVRYVTIQATQNGAAASASGSASLSVLIGYTWPKAA